MEHPNQFRFQTAACCGLLIAVLSALAPALAHAASIVCETMTYDVDPDSQQSTFRTYCMEMVERIRSRPVGRRRIEQIEQGVIDIHIYQNTSVASDGTGPCGNSLCIYWTDHATMRDPGTPSGTVYLYDESTLFHELSHAARGGTTGGTGDPDEELRTVADENQYRDEAALAGHRSGWSSDVQLSAGGLPCESMPLVDCSAGDLHGGTCGAAFGDADYRGTLSCSAYCNYDTSGCTNRARMEFFHNVLACCSCSLLDPPPPALLELVDAGGSSWIALMGESSPLQVVNGPVGPFILYYRGRRDYDDPSVIVHDCPVDTVVRTFSDVISAPETGDFQLNVTLVTSGNYLLRLFGPLVR